MLNHQAFIAASFSAQVDSRRRACPVTIAPGPIARAVAYLRVGSLPPLARIGHAGCALAVAAALGGIFIG